MGRSGIRCEWIDVPVHIRAEVEHIAGARIVSARNIDGGFSPGPAARCDLDDGRTVFVKAAGTVLNEISPLMHRREGQVLAALPFGIPAPSLIGLVDDGDWVAIVTSWNDGTMPTLPLTSADCGRVVGLVERLGEFEWGIAGGALAPVGVAHPDLSGHWRRLYDEPVEGLDAWTSAHLGDLVRLEADHSTVIEGDHIVHLDLRTDNILLGPTESDDVIVDWPGACRGAPWIDLVALLPSLHLDGAPEPEAMFRASRIGHSADADAVDVFLASIAGYFTRMSLLLPPPGLPTVRRFQAAQGVVARQWLRQRLETR